MTADCQYVPQPVPRMPDDAGLLRFLSAMITNPLTAIPSSAYREGVSVSACARSRFAFICDPEILEEILVRRFGDFPKSYVDQRIMRPAVGDSLLVAEGDAWRWKRRLAAPFFTPAVLARSAADIVAPFQVLAWKWQDRLLPEVDVVPPITAATLDVIDRLLFSGKGEIDANALTRALNDYLEPVSWRIGYASLGIPSWVPFPGRGRTTRAKTAMRNLIFELIKRRRATAAPHSDICDQLMSARDPETGRLLSDEDLVDMLLSLVAAGHETTANAMSWAIFCLAEAPWLQTLLVEEIQSVVGHDITRPEHVPRLAKVKAFLCETMRLFPPVPYMSRRTIKTETLGGHVFRPGTILFIPIYAIHRHERLWSNPARFDLSRFLDGADKAIARTAFLPFGAGPRICLGASLAIMEMTIGLATLLRAVRFERVKGFSTDPIARITLRPRHGLTVRLANSA